jgi:hypothetical protein
MWELETETNYTEENTNKVEKEDDNLTAEQQKMMKRNREMKPPIASRFQDVNRATEKLKKISDDCKIQKDEFDFFARSLAIELKKDSIRTRSDLSTKAITSNDG